MKKVLFVSPLPPPYYGSAISSEMCLDILRCEDQFAVENVKINATDSMRNVGKFSSKKLFDVARVWWNIIRLCLSFKPHINYIVPATAGFALFRDFSIILLIRCFSSGKLIIHLRSRYLDDDFDNKIKAFVIRKMLKSENVILLGKELLPNLNGFVAEEKIIFLPNAIPLHLSENAYNNLNQKRKLKNDRLNILFLSNMNMEKGWLKVLESLVVLKNKEIDFACNFVGAWPSNKERDIFYSYIESNNLVNSVQYHGPAYNDDKNKHLENTDILVFPTEYKMETFGRVIIEAMEYGIPVIANGIAAIPSIINHGETGFVLKENTGEEISEYIIYLMDKKNRNEMGAKARTRFIEKFTLDTYKNNFLEIFTSK